MATAAETLAGFAADLAFEDLPPSVRQSAVLRVLDTPGCALAGSRGDFAAPVLDLVRESAAPGGSVVWGSGFTAPPPMAALANGCLAHGLDFEPYPCWTAESLAPMLAAIRSE